jgi:hypothetical protein
MIEFIAAGPPRTGTSWLDNIFRGHIGLPEHIKETHFFDLYYSRGFEWYARQFRNCGADVPTGEFAPSYFSMPEARERVARHLPNCKIIFTLREPVDRMYSHYKMLRRLALVKAPFEIIAERHKDLLSYTRYAFHIKEWQKKFGIENTLVMIYEDTRNARQAYVDRICTFIGAEPLNLATIPHDHQPAAQVETAPRSRRIARCARQLRGWLLANGHFKLRNQLQPLFLLLMSGGDKFPPLDRAFRQMLQTRFEPEVAEVEELLGRHLSVWRQNGNAQ